MQPPKFMWLEGDGWSTLMRGPHKLADVDAAGRVKILWGNQSHEYEAHDIASGIEYVERWFKEIGVL